VTNIKLLFIFAGDLPPTNRISMKLTNTSEYALRILTFMAKDPSKLYSAKSLVDTLDISDKYLRRLMTSLCKQGFIYSIQGREGGYGFNKQPSEIILADVIDAVEGIDTYTGCVLGFEECSCENPCVMHSTWSNVRDEFLKVFTEKTLADMDFEQAKRY
jgi:Rrf2 family iron-sulfur cluster assembly transcriptional regulator